MSKVALNTPAPDFELPDFTGKTVRLSDFRGKTNVLLVFNRGFM
jgi:peroxiredoxin